MAEKVVCPECGSHKIVYDRTRGEWVCRECGYVFDEPAVDSGPEWRAFDAEQMETRARTGAPMKETKIGKGLTTIIDMHNRDTRGSQLAQTTKAQMFRIRKWHKRTTVSSSMERNLSVALTEIKRIGSYLNLPDGIIEEAAAMYRKAVEKGLIRGRLIEAVVAAVIYAVCRIYGIPRTLDEIAEASGLSKKDIGRTYRFIVNELKLKVPLTNPVYYVPKFASALRLSGEVQEEAIRILQKAINKGLLSGRGPTGVAAAAVYIAALLKGERRTQKEVAEVAGVTEVTIRNRYRELKKELSIPVNA
ncbi:MAG TPA: transcription initiation factor IIB [Euryarchaeota archaeon]|nr:transcription initiation factor IIB [Euryarchaeota archaeon]